MNLLQTGSISVVVRYIMAEQVSVGQKRGRKKRQKSLIKETWDPIHILYLKNLKQQVLALARGPPISLSFGPSRQKVWARPSSDSSQYSCKTFI